MLTINLKDRVVTGSAKVKDIKRKGLLLASISNKVKQG
jgi:hypothetical protein